MSRDLINLLPADRARTFRRDYFVRLAVVALLLLSALVVIHAVLLLPSYLHLSVAETAKQRELDAAQQKLANSEQGQVTNRLASLQSDAAYLARLSEQPSASGAVRALLAVPRRGIALSSITVAPPAAAGAPGKITLTGMAATREDLRAYDLALSDASFVSSVDLPVSAYAEAANIDFTLTITGSLTP